MAAAMFGKPAGTPGFNFGGSAATPQARTATTTSGLFGGALGASTPATSFGLGTTTTASGGLSLGGLSAAAKPTTFSGFGQPAATTAASSGFSFGQSSTTSAAPTSNVLSFSGLQTVNPGSSGTSLFSASQPKTTGSFPLLGTTTSTSAPTLVLGGLGSTTGTTTTASTTGGLFGALTSTKAPTSTIGLTSAAVTGLGGTGTSSTVSLAGTVTGIAGKQSEIQNLKDNQVPAPLVKIVEEIKKYVKQQKEHRDEISRFSVSSIQKVQEETMSLRQSLAVVSNSIQRDACAVENLKMDVAQELKNAEIAQHTSEIPPALQHENIAPQEYFQRLVESFEERMQVYRKQIEIMESHLASLSQGQTLTPQDLSNVMHKVHETFIALAAQLHGIHEAVKLQKEHYLNYRKAYFKDSTDVFSRRRINARPNVAVPIGPSPFTGIPNSTTKSTSNQRTNLPTRSQFGTTTVSSFGSSFGTGLSSSTSSLGTGGSLGSSSTGLGSSLGFKGFGTQTAGTSTGFGVGAQAAKPNTGFSFGTPTNTGLGSSFGAPATSTSAFGTKFELQKPPAGNKRGKKRF